MNRGRTIAALTAAFIVADLGAIVALPALAAEPVTAGQRVAAVQHAVAADRAAAGRMQDPSEPQVVKRSTAHPTRVVIPAIGVDAALERLHRDSSGELAAPTVADEAGWFAEGVVPGDHGPAVIAGHLDNVLGPAVFVDLRKLRPGDRIAVRMSDRTTERFVVTAAKVVRKARFPSDAVYGATPDAQLRLITCNEPFDSEAHGYADNLVVFAAKADAVS